MTVQERQEKAMNARMQGYNCAQCLLLAFDDIIPLDKESLLKVSAAFGTGLGLGEACGVVTGMAIAQGLIIDSADAKAKIQAMIASKTVGTKFRENNGYIRCADLKGSTVCKPCNELICNGIEILAEYLQNNG